MTLFELMAKISLDTSEYEEGLDKSEKQAKSFKSSLSSGLKTAAKAGGIALAAIGTAAAAAGAAILKGAGEAAEYGDRIDKMSQKIGFSAKGFQEWDFILQHNGASIESVQRGMITLEKSAKEGSEAFDKLGISQEDLASMNSEQLWDATIRGLQNVADGSERAKLAEELFGKGARELGPLLNMTAEETEAMKKQVNDLGGVMSDEAVKSAAAYQDSLQNMQTTFGGLKRSIFSEFMPGITSVMDGLTMIFSGDTEGGVGKINEGVSDMVTKISEGLPKVLEIGGQIISGLLQAISSNLPNIVQSGAQILMDLIVGIVNQLPQLIEMAPEIISGLANALIQAAPALLKAGEAILLKLLEIGANLGEKLKELIMKGLEKLKELFHFEWNIPKVKLPHFAVRPAGWKIGDLLKGVIPSLGVSWYKKAYDTPYMFDRPTVVGNKGFGDGSGAEMVYGRDSLMRDIRQAVGGQNINFSPTINIMGDIEDPKEKAQQLMYEMKEIFDREAAAYGA